MAGKHSLQGLIKWLTRDPWRDRFPEVLDSHTLHACEELGLDVDDLVSTLGEDFFMSTVWACAFEDFLTREFDDGSNIVDDYLKRRGWKETASVRSYMAALRRSVVSLYEVSDVVRDTSFRARDLLRGGEPMLISERAATRSLKQWDRIAARVVQVGPQALVSGAVLPYEHAASEEILGGLRKFGNLSKKERRELADALGQTFDEAAIADLTRAELLLALTPMITSVWLINMMDRANSAGVADIRNAEGDELVICTSRYPLAAGTTGDDIRTALERCPELRRADATFWNWVGPGRLDGPSGVQKRPPESLSFETWLDDGSLVLGGVELDEGTLVLSVNSRARSDLGRTLLSGTLGELIGEPLVEMETVEQLMASRNAGSPPQQDFPEIPEDQACAIIHDKLDRHYRDLLDQPIPMLGNKSPRAAAKTASGRIKVVDWLKMIENRTAKSGDNNRAMANYSFSWLWTELGVSELRR
jgi:hypothetical protein